MRRLRPCKTGTWRKVARMLEHHSRGHPRTCRRDSLDQDCCRPSCPNTSCKAPPPPPRRFRPLRPGAPPPARSVTWATSPGRRKRPVAARILQWNSTRAHAREGTRPMMYARGTQPSSRNKNVRFRVPVPGTVPVLGTTGTRQ